MAASEVELAPLVHHRARRAVLAGLAALNDSLAREDGPALPKLTAEVVHDALSLAVLRFLALGLGAGQGLFARRSLIEKGRLFAVQEPLLHVSVELTSAGVRAEFPAALAGAESAFHEQLERGLGAAGVDLARCPPELIGHVYELLLSDAVTRTRTGFELASGARRKQTGTFFTPRALTEVVVARALDALAAGTELAALELRVCDPAAGGGAFLLEVARSLSARADQGSMLERRRAVVTRVLHGVDINPVALAAAEAALYLFAADPELELRAAGANLRLGDALVGEPARGPRKERAKLGRGLDFPREFPAVFARGGFDLVIGNPPWVAYAGRAAQPLAPARKAYLSAQYESLRGYPTLHGMFVERALQLAPRGTVALVVPSPIADLHGYRAVRRVVRRAHALCEPMLEFGQDAFASVTQPCFALIARAHGSPPSSSQADDEQPFRLAERQRAAAHAVELEPPAILRELAERAPFPRELFGEMGFQTSGQVTRRLLLRASEPDARHDYPLLEGRNVHEFVEHAPRLFLAPDPELLAASRCRLRPAEDYRRVAFVVRQTARYPIAALHGGLPFRNSLLAGFAISGLEPALVVGLLNSSLYRALHVAARRDARQAVFPQVKIAHLRALPRPPMGSPALARIAELTTELTNIGLESARLAELDALVFALFSCSESAAREVSEFLRSRGAARLNAAAPDGT